MPAHVSKWKLPLILDQSHPILWYTLKIYSAMLICFSFSFTSFNNKNLVNLFIKVIFSISWSLYFLSFLFVVYVSAPHKRSAAVVEGEIRWDKRKTYRTSSREHDGCSLLMAMQPPVRCIVRPFQPMRLPVAFRTMVWPNRLIKLNRANESRTNPAWGMDTCVRAARSCDCKRAAVARSPILRPSRRHVGEKLWES